MADAQDYNAAYHTNTINEANARSNEAYQQGMLEQGRQDLAFRKAQQAWKEVMDKTGLTGMYEDQWTLPAQMGFAEAFGTWGAPTQGQQTLAGQQQQWRQAFDTAGQYGQYVGPGGPQQGQQTLAGSEQGFTQGLRTQQEQRAAQAQQQGQAQEYLKLLASLRGPADWAKYQQVLGAGGNMNSLAAAAMGQYVPGGGATSGYQPQAASLQSMMGQVSGQPYYGQGGGPLNMPNVYQYNPAVYGQQTQYQTQGPGNIGGQMQNPQWQQAGQYGGADRTAAMLEGQMNPQMAAEQARLQASAPGGGMTGGNNQQVNAMGNGTNTMGAPQQNQMNLPAPNQIAPQSWQNMAPSQRDMLMGEYEAQGWHKPDVEVLYNQSLTKYGSNAPTAGTFRLNR